MFSNETRGNGKYANFKHGKIIHDGETYTTVEGRIVFVQVDDAEYEGKGYRKLTLTLRGEDGKEVLLGFPINSGYGQAFCCMCPNIDTDEPVKISGGTEKKNGKNYSSMFIEQNGKFVKWFYAKDREKQLPPPEVIKNKKGIETGKDWSERNEYMEKLIGGFEKNIVKSLKKNVGNGSATTKTLKHEKPQVGMTDQPFDDLPF